MRTVGLEKDRFGHLGEILTEVFFTDDRLIDFWGEIEMAGNLQTFNIGFF